MLISAGATNKWQDLSTISAHNNKPNNYLSCAVFFLFSLLLLFFHAFNCVLRFFLFRVNCNVQTKSGWFCTKEEIFVLELIMRWWMVRLVTFIIDTIEKYLQESNAKCIIIRIIYLAISSNETLLLH